MVKACLNLNELHQFQLGGHPWLRCFNCDGRSKSQKVDQGSHVHYFHTDKMLAGAAFDLLVDLTDMQEHYRPNELALEAGKNAGEPVRFLETRLIQRMACHQESHHRPP